MLPIKPVRRNKLPANKFAKQKGQTVFSLPFFIFGVPTRSRTAVTGVKGPCPRPLDDGDVVRRLTK